MKEGEKIGNFRVERISWNPLYEMEMRFLRHESLGFEVFHLKNDDPHHFFAFSFLTPPFDHTGIFHIIEHCVFCGSRRFPVKDIFSSVLKTSPNTFMNAMTYPDKTVYAASSVIEKDFAMLFEVYADAVFFPLLEKEAFWREGIRLEFKNQKPSLGGVVYNEMKGVYSSLEEYVDTQSLRSLFLKGPYHYDFGGEPEAIAFLTYEKFRETHQKYYHPSNAQLLLYGNMNLEKQLDFLEKEFLSSFVPLKKEGLGVLESFQKEMQENMFSSWRSQRIPVELEEEKENYFSVNYLANQIQDVKKTVSLSIFSDIVFSDASSLVKTLLEGDFGEDLLGSTGYLKDMYYGVLGVGMRKTKKNRFDDFQHTLSTQWKKFLEEGLDQKLVDVQVFQYEFAQKEMKANKGLFFMNKVLRYWNYRSAPETFFQSAQILEEIKKELAQGKKIFESLIEEFLIDPKHATALSFESTPEKEVQKKEDQFLERVFSHFSKKDFEQEEALIQAYRERMDPEDALVLLKREDVLSYPLEKLEVEPVQQTPYFFGVYRTKTQGIASFHLNFNVDDMEEEFFPYFSLYTRLIDQVGTKTLSEAEFLKELLSVFGSLSFRFSSETYAATKALKRYFWVSFYILDSSAQKAFELLREMISELNFHNKKKIREAFLNLRNDIESNLAPKGHLFAKIHAESHFSPSARDLEMQAGLSALKIFRGIKDTEASWDMLSSKLQEMHEMIWRKERFSVMLTTEKEHFFDLKEHSDFLYDQLPTGENKTQAKSLEPRKENQVWVAGKKEGVVGEPEGRGSRDKNLFHFYVFPFKVNYIAWCFPSISFIDPDYPVLQIISHLLKTGKLWEKIRGEGGAYGVDVRISFTEGVLSLISYRDVNLGATLESFQKAFENLKEEIERGEWKEEDLEKAKISLIAEEIEPSSPYTKGYLAYTYFLAGISYEKRKELVERLFRVNLTDLRRIVETLGEEMKKGSICVLGGKEMAKKISLEWKKEWSFQEKKI